MASSFLTNGSDLNDSSRTEKGQECVGYYKCNLLGSHLWLLKGLEQCTEMITCLFPVFDQPFHCFVVLHELISVDWNHFFLTIESDDDDSTKS